VEANGGAGPDLAPGADRPGVAQGSRIDALRPTTIERFRNVHPERTTA